MNTPDENKSENLESVTEDLTVNEDQSGDVKGGPDGSVRFLKDTIDAGVWR